LAAGRHTHPASELSCQLANERPNGSGTELFYSIDSQSVIVLINSVFFIDLLTL